MILAFCFFIYLKIKGLFAKRDIKKGELVMEYENKERTIVSKSFVERNFKELEKDWFKNYAYPLGDEIFVTWSDNPDKHTPLNHSCEPNLWHDHPRTKMSIDMLMTCQIS